MGAPEWTHQQGRGDRAAGGRDAAALGEAAARPLDEPAAQRPGSPGQSHVATTGASIP